ncbi:uncharacterized protein DFL_007540 [Arthrobotrys flagrans]|uniref:Uncharacterized protein n=1 Tax=Arthrobotrys flagrans TaxID=97331 RepID=A0A436ZVZ3_ARTFL|nr:hypothetical protein DFL_007540 [Arthrobotrys flagrans]
MRISMPLPPTDPITPPESEPEPLLPLYTPSTTLPPAYTTHRSDRLLLYSSSSSSQSLKSEELSEKEQRTTGKLPLFSITGHTRLKIHNYLRLIHRLLFCFLLLNTALFALIVYNLDETSLLTIPGAEDRICPCPLQQLNYPPPVPREYGSVALSGRWAAVGECYAFLNKGVGVLERKEYEKLGVWRECVEEVGKVREWREWAMWVAIPVMCVVEAVAAWSWWWCLREVEREEEQEGVQKRGKV